MVQLVSNTPNAGDAFRPQVSKDRTEIAGPLMGIGLHLLNSFAVADLLAVESTGAVWVAETHAASLCGRQGEDQELDRRGRRT